MGDRCDLPASVQDVSLMMLAQGGASRRQRDSRLEFRRTHNVWGVVMQNFLANIPQEIENAARVNG